MMVILLTPVTFATLVTLVTLVSLVTLITLVILVNLVTLVTLVTLFRSANQFYRAECITVSGFFIEYLSNKNILICMVYRIDKTHSMYLCKLGKPNVLQMSNCSRNMNRYQA